MKSSPFPYEVDTSMCHVRRAHKRRRGTLNPCLPFSIICFPFARVQSEQYCLIGKKKVGHMSHFCGPVKRSEVKSLSRVRLFATPWTVAYQASPSTEFFKQEYWSGLPFPSPGDLPDSWIELEFPSLQADSLPLHHLGSPILYVGVTPKKYKMNICFIF